MFPRWLWLNHVPAGLVLTEAQRAEVRRRVRAMGSGKPKPAPMAKRILVRLLPAVALLTLVFVFWLIWLVRSAPRTWAIPLNIGGIFAFQALLWIAIAWAINRAMAPIVWKAINQVGVRVCEGCGYILEHSPPDSTHCPECGMAIEKAVGDVGNEGAR